MIEWRDHLVIGPIVLPLFVAAAMLLLDERRRIIKGVLSLSAMAAILIMALVLLHESATGGSGGGDTARIYRLGGWAAPYGIVLVADRLSTFMVALTSVLGACSLIFALARWDRAGPRFHALFLLLAMGVNGAFLTGDLFNLFVFFEIMLAASYGLALHGSGEARIRAGLTYIAVNLTASLLFLIGVSLIYGVTGTLNMADLALRLPAIAEGNRGLFHVGAAVLGTAFLIKCAMWPVGFWLTPTYAAASAPAAAAFAILSKVGVYVIIRLSLLLFGADAAASAGFGQGWLLAGGLATMGFGTAGLLASRDLSRAAGYGVIVSSGTVLAIVGIGGPAALSGAIFYLAGCALRADHWPGLPPLSGFIGKLAMMDALARVGDVTAWTMVAALSLSSLGALIGLTRAGVAAIWGREEDAPRLVVGAAEFTAIAGLLGACVLLSVFGGSALIYAEHTADWLSRPEAYVQAVLSGGGR